MGKITTTFQFDDEIYWRFKDKCKDDGVTMISRLEIWIRNYLQQPKDDQEIRNIENTVSTMTIDEIKTTIEKIKNLYEKTDEPNRKGRLGLIAKRLKERYQRLQETDETSNQTKSL